MTSSDGFASTIYKFGPRNTMIEEKESVMFVCAFYIHKQRVFTFRSLLFNLFLSSTSVSKPLVSIEVTAEKIN